MWDSDSHSAWVTQFADSWGGAGSAHHGRRRRFSGPPSVARGRSASRSVRRRLLQSHRALLILGHLPLKRARALQHPMHHYQQRMTAISHDQALRDEPRSALSDLDLVRIPRVVESGHDLHLRLLRSPVDITRCHHLEEQLAANPSQFAQQPDQYQRQRHASVPAMRITALHSEPRSAVGPRVEALTQVA